MAGVAALVDGIRHEGDISPAHVKHVLAGTADEIGPEDIFANGRVNASKAVKKQHDGGGD